MAAGSGPEAVGEGLPVFLGEGLRSLKEPGSREVIGQPPARVLIRVLVVVGGATLQFLVGVVIDLDSDLLRHAPTVAGPGPRRGGMSGVICQEE